MSQDHNHHDHNCSCGCNDPHHIHLHDEAAAKDAIKFPCTYPLKAFGQASPDLVNHTWQLLAPLIPGLTEHDFKLSASKQGRYTAMTVTFTATSRAQLDSIYAALKEDKRILAML